ncbi:hypothetical protein HanRHA438_Chr03g0098081 [Helianthus annuus]|nr:hypothetical protein HanIR_Chr00c27g0911091 [Helianthus annuus]KAJ0933607.1 hypothetical protein HanRHA438_Chr03g0098081 [Helianthus annuus]
MCIDGFNVHFGDLLKLWVDARENIIEENAKRGKTEPNSAPETVQTSFWLILS